MAKSSKRKNGTRENDVLTGTPGDDMLVGNGGKDVLSGLEGNDSLYGGARQDKLYGGLGNDLLDGGTDRDLLVGGAGDDTYLVDHPGDRVVEKADGGIDTVLSHARSYKMAANVENARIMSADKANLNGNGLDNVIYAGTGDNHMNAGKGVDTVSYEFGVTGDAGVVVNLGAGGKVNTGGSGRDHLVHFENAVGSVNDDLLCGNKGDNVLDGLGGNDSLVGGAGSDTLFGNDGDDLLVGGVGSDALEGGAGNDTFDFNGVADLSTDAAATDVIEDFVRGEDRIDLSGIDAIAGTTLDEGFTFIGDTDFSSTDASGQLRYSFDAEAGVGYLSGSTDADADAEFVVQVVGVAELDAADFAL